MAARIPTAVSPAVLAEPAAVRGWLNQALPFRARLALAHLTKADDILTHINVDERAAYVERVKAGA